MKALRIPGTPQEVPQALLFGFEISRSKKTFKTETAPSLLLEAKLDGSNPISS
jgi:hypothetical protein